MGLGYPTAVCELPAGPADGTLTAFISASAAPGVYSSSDPDNCSGLGVYFQTTSIGEGSGYGADRSETAACETNGEVEPLGSWTLTLTTVGPEMDVRGNLICHGTLRAQVIATYGGSVVFADDAGESTDAGLDDDDGGAATMFVLF